MANDQGFLDFQEGEFVIEDFAFRSGEVLASLRLGYFTMGRKRLDADGGVSNAVLLIHNTTGSGRSWLSPSLAGDLFGTRQVLDLENYFVVVPDMIGFAGSSKPSDGMRSRFPKYRYEDMVTSTHLLLTQGLGLQHVRAIIGLSMGGMLTWMWGQMYPDYMDGLVPIASQPGPMSGRNWIQRRISIEAIRNDPDWNNGDYESNPRRYIYTAPIGGLMIQSVVRLQQIAPTRQAADDYYRSLVERASKGDANDRLYQLEASMDYDPSPGLEKIKARLLAINFADDELNPPELGVVEAALPRLADAEYVLIPAGPETFGHSSALHSKLWNAHLSDFLDRL